MTQRPRLGSGNGEWMDFMMIFKRREKRKSWKRKDK